MLTRKLITFCIRNVKHTCFKGTYTNWKDVQHLNCTFLRLNYVTYIIRRHAATNTSATIYEQDKEAPVISVQEYKTKHGPTIKCTILKLQQLLDISEDQAKELLKKNPKLKRVSVDSIAHNVELYEAADITKAILLEYPVLLSLEFVERKVKHLQELSTDINLIAPLLTADVRLLKRIIEDAKMEEDFIPYGNRIVYMSKLLNLPAPFISERLVSHSYVFRIPLQRFENILKVLLEYGIDPNNIMNDCWALRYNPQAVEERLQRAIKANVTRVKTWMIRCPERIFQRCINRQMENRKILGANSSVEEYLSKRLECTIENATYLTEKYPAIMRMNILKMKEMLDFIFEQGYTPTHVCRVPRILIHSLETTKVRLQQLKQIGYIPPSLAILCKSKRDFDKILKKYTKHKKTADMECTQQEDA